MNEDGSGLLEPRIEDHSDWLVFSKANAKHLARERRPQMEESSQAKVAAENLTGDAYWDVFLQQVQAKIKNTEGQLESVKTHFAGPGNPTQEELTGMHRMAVHLRTKLEAFREVLEMPAEIIKKGEAADAELADGSDDD